jgi:hypothetical protein
MGGENIDIGLAIFIYGRDAQLLKKHVLSTALSVAKPE